jgi:AraC-like DNA-binding protein
MIPAAQVVEIRRLFFAEHWRVGTIAAQLGLHPDTVRRALATERFARPTVVRPSLLDPYRAVLQETLQRYPRLRATRLFEMVRQRGYAGSVVQLRRLVRTLRPAPAAEAYLRLTLLMGEQGQADWGSFGTVTIGRATRPCRLKPSYTLRSVRECCVFAVSVRSPSGSKTTMSANMPIFNNPRRSSPRFCAGRLLSLRMASASGTSFSSRTYFPRKRAKLP